MSKDEPRPATNQTGVRHFWSGAFATFVVYSVFYLRNSDAVLAYCKDMGLLGTVGALMALTVLVTASGFWARINKPRTVKQAFCIGLGAPALIFAASLGGNPQALPMKRDATVSKASFFLGLEARLLFDYARPVVAPLSTVQQHTLALAERAFDAKHQELVEQAGQVPALKDQLRLLDSTLAAVRAEADDSRGRLIMAQHGLEDCKEETRQLKQALQGFKARAAALDTERDEPTAQQPATVSAKPVPCEECPQARDLAALINWLDLGPTEDRVLQQFVGRWTIEHAGTRERGEVTYQAAFGGKIVFGYPRLPRLDDRIRIGRMMIALVRGAPTPDGPYYSVWWDARDGSLDLRRVIIRRFDILGPRLEMTFVKTADDATESATLESLNPKVLHLLQYEETDGRERRIGEFLFQRP